ncbi:hypothetical protein BOTNAR_0218g00050 [Botryotinia narcissicola]|uniref:Uncharacterized protein n=1 Tax=Botryotinia narcissicola TaxID=278944 RepID=A0A4Z1IJ26_9HELO|nr:hypothetical protein BOTNAR_0218g00050 [Botryotinia narcissicola]
MYAICTTQQSSPVPARLKRAIADVRLFAWSLESRVGVCCGLVKDMYRGGVISFDIDDEGYFKM